MEIYEINYLYNARNCGCFTFWILFPGETFRIYYASKRLVLLLPTSIASLLKLTVNQNFRNCMFQYSLKFILEHSWFLAEYFVFMNNFKTISENIQSAYISMIWLEICLKFDMRQLSLNQFTFIYTRMFHSRSVCLHC